MNEGSFRKAIHRRLPPESVLHRQSMTSASLTFNGTPDDYYDGSKRDLWLESKWLKHMPRDGIVVADATELQKRWLNRRQANGGNAFIVVGLPNKTGVLMTPPQYEGHVRDAISFDEIAQWICDFCLRSYARSPR